MSEQKVDTKKEEPEKNATAMLVVSESDPDKDADTTTTFEDPESATPQNLSEKLSSIDNKAFLFAGYVFWGLIFLSGGATAAVLLSTKKPAPLSAPSAAPTFSESPTVTLVPSEAPSAAPSAAPSYSACSHFDIKEKLLSFFGTDNCVEVVNDDGNGNGNILNCTEDIKGLSVQAIYEFIPQGGTFAIPHKFTGTFSDRRGVVHIDPLPRDGNPCTFHEADDFFKRLTLCHLGEIEDKLYSYFDKDKGCTTDGFNDGYMTECKLLSGWNRERTEASFNYTFSSEEPKTLEISYSQDSTPPDVVDLDLTGDVSPFDEATSAIFERLAERCEEPHNQIKTWMDNVFGAKSCKESDQNGNPVYFCQSRSDGYYLGTFITSYAAYEYRSIGDFLVPEAFGGDIRSPGRYSYGPGEIDFSKIGNSCDHYLNGSDEYEKARVVLDTIERAKDPDWTPGALCAYDWVVCK